MCVCCCDDPFSQQWSKVRVFVCVCVRLRTIITHVTFKIGLISFVEARNIHYATRITIEKKNSHYRTNSYCPVAVASCQLPVTIGIQKDIRYGKQYVLIPVTFIYASLLCLIHVFQCRCIFNGTIVIRTQTERYSNIERMPLIQPNVESFQRFDSVQVVYCSV